MRSGTVAPTTAPRHDRPDASTLGAPHSATRRATSSCHRPPSRQREVLQVRRPRVRRPHEREQAPAARGGRLDERGDRVAAEARVDRERVDRRPQERIGIRPGRHVDVPPLRVRDHQQPRVGARRGDALERLPARGAEPLERRQLQLHRHARRPRRRDRPPAERPRALRPARDPPRIRVEAQHHLARPVLHRRRQPLAEPGGCGGRGHSSTARHAGRVTVARSVVTTTAPARTSERSP